MTPIDIDKLDAIHARLNCGDARMTRIEARIEENTDLTRDIRNLMDAGRAGLRVLEWLGKAARWAGILATACMAIYVAIYTITHDGRPPQP